MTAGEEEQIEEACGPLAALARWRPVTVPQQGVASEQRATMEAGAFNFVTVPGARKEGRAFSVCPDLQSAAGLLVGAGISGGADPSFTLATHCLWRRPRRSHRPGHDGPEENGADRGHHRSKGSRLGDHWRTWERTRVSSRVSPWHDGGPSVWTLVEWLRHARGASLSRLEAWARGFTWEHGISAKARGRPSPLLLDPTLQDHGLL